MAVVATSTLHINHSYRAYVVALLVVVGSLAWMDRNVFSVLLQPIKNELSLTDTELGLIGGTAFGLFFAIVGLPLGWLADRTNRKYVIGSAVAFWSAMTMLCGLASSFTSMFIARAGLAAGEAGGTPPSHSIVSDYFPPRSRAFALGVLYLYIPLGALTGFAIGGWLNDMLGWRMTFIVLGALGILVAALLFATLQVPQRGYSDGRPLPATRRTPFWSTLWSFARNRTLRQVPVAGSIFGIGLFAVVVWMPAYLTRSYGMTSTETGQWMALAFGVAGAAGTLLGGRLTDKIASMSRNDRWYAWVPALSTACAAPFFAAALVTSSAAIACACLVLAAFVAHLYLGPMTATMQALAQPSQRSMASAFYLFFANIIGSGLGPTLIGVVSDYYSADAGVNALRYALLTVVPAASLWSATHFYLLSRTLSADLARARN